MGELPGQSLTDDFADCLRMVDVISVIDVVDSPLTPNAGRPAAKIAQCSVALTNSNPLVLGRQSSN